MRMLDEVMFGFFLFVRWANEKGLHEEVCAPGRRLLIVRDFGASADEAEIGIETC